MIVVAPFLARIEYAPSAAANDRPSPRQFPEPRVNGSRLPATLHYHYETAPGGREKAAANDPQYGAAKGRALYEEYNPFGTTAYWSANSGINVSRKRYRYIGKERDEETGLYQLGARYYASWLGRWTAADPIGLAGGINRFEYANSNPIKLLDRGGNKAEAPSALVSSFEALKSIRDVMKTAGVDTKGMDQSLRKLQTVVQAEVRREARNEQVRGYVGAAFGTIAKGAVQVVQNNERGIGVQANVNLVGGIYDEVSSGGVIALATGTESTAEAARQLVSRATGIPDPVQKDSGYHTIGRGFAEVGMAVAAEAAVASSRAAGAAAAAKSGGKGLVERVAGWRAGAAKEGAGTLLGIGGSGDQTAGVVLREIKHGEKVAGIVAEAKSLTFSTGREHAVLSLEGGRRVIVQGGEKGMSLGHLPVRRVIGHSHPYHTAPTGPSAADISALESLGQKASYLLEHGVLSKFRVP